MKLLLIATWITFDFCIHNDTIFISILLKVDLFHLLLKYSNTLRYALFTCVILGDMHFCVVSENTSDMNFLMKCLMQCTLRCATFYIFTWSYALFWGMHFFEICTFPWSCAFLRFNFITNLMKCKLQQCNICWDTYVTNSNLKECNFYVTLH